MISVQHISKTFLLPHERRLHIRDYFVNLFSPMSYEHLHILDDVSFEVADGEWLGVIGDNGAGKSTLLKILAEIYYPDSGAIKIHGRAIPFLELGIGFQPDLSARDNIYINGLLLGIPRRVIDEKFDEILDFAEVSSFVDQKLKNFSSGMKLRLGFAIATYAPANVFLLDEILSVGDYSFQQKSLHTFKNKLRDKTVIFVSHDLLKIKEYCHKVLWLKKGRLAGIGNPDKIIGEYLEDQYKLIR